MLTELYKHHKKLNNDANNFFIKFINRANSVSGVLNLREVFRKVLSIFTPQNS